MKQKLLNFFIGGMILTSVAFAQERKVTGRVTSATGSGIPGVTVLVQGSTVATQTDENGNYTLNAPVGKTILFRSVGFSERTLVVSSTSSIFNVSLESNSQDLEEVLIQVPYGSVKRSSYVGSESTVSSQQLTNQPVASVTKALDGLVPGLQTTNGGGQPGSNATIRVRGIGSINAGSGPLIVLDGVPFVGGLEAINTDDIASVTVLKDATSTALYGSRGSNGVIMVQTKRGRSNDPKLTLNVRGGYQQRAFAEYDRVDPKQYYELMWEATRNRIANSPDNAGNTPERNAELASLGLIPALVYNVTNVADDKIVGLDGKFNPDAKILYQDDWADALIRTPYRQDYNLNVTGGSDKSTYFMSLGYLSEPGVVKNSEYKRYTARVGVDTKVKTWLNTGLNLDGTLGKVNNFTTTSTATSNPWYFTRLMGPIYPVYERNKQGEYVIDPVTGGHQLDWGVPTQMGGRPYAGNSNLLGSLALDDRIQQRGNVNANTYIEAKFLKDFTFRTTLGGTYYNNYGTVYQNSQYGDAQNVRGRSTKSETRDLTLTFNQVLTYDKSIGDHNFNVLVGHENYSYTRDYLYATRSGFPFPGSSELAPAATAEGSSSFQDKHSVEGYFSNVRYDYKEKYLLSGSFRRDGSSRFFPGNDVIKNNQWGNFWSVGGAWRLSQEDFIKNVSWISDLKLKASYGKQGNEDILNADGSSNYYTYQSLYNLGDNNVNRPGATIASLPNPELRWEKSGMFNVGIDFGLFNNKLTGTVEWYNKNTQDLLFQEPLALSTGISSIWRNVGDMNNKGWDINVGYRAISNESFQWRVDVNLTTYKNKITKLSENSRATGIISGTKKLMEGHSIYDFWIREYAGVDRETGLALYSQDVTNADGTVTKGTTSQFDKATLYWQGSAIPDFSGGIQNSFAYKNFDLSVLLNFSVGGKFYDGNYASLMHTGNYGSNWSTDILNRWTPDNKDTDVPRIQNNITNNTGVSSRFLFDRSWLNIKNIALGYTLPKATVNQIGIEGLRIFANADNMFLFTKRKGMDPGRSFTGTSDFTYVPIRTVTFGVTLSL